MPNLHHALPRALAAAALIGFCMPARGSVRPMVGSEKVHVVRRGETLFRIARRHGLSALAVQRANGLPSRRIRPGMKLRLPTRHILPAVLPNGIVLNIPERALYVFVDGRLAGRYAVAVGMPSWQTAQGQFRLRNRVINPTWDPPDSMVRREGIRDVPVPPGPENPLGDRWMGWTKPGFGFHSTTLPRSIGLAASHGCVRLYPEAARRMFGQVKVGMPILSLYEPLLLGTDNGRFYLAAHEDVYRTGRASPERARALLEACGLLPLVDDRQVARILARSAGVPERIAGEDEDVFVGDKKLVLPVAPLLAKGSWWVPVRPLVEALGGSVAAQAEGLFVVTAGGRTLLLSTRGAPAHAEGEAAAATVVDGTLVAPLRPLVHLHGATVDWERRKALRIVPGSPR